MINYPFLMPTTHLHVGCHCHHLRVLYGYAPRVTFSPGWDYSKNKMVEWLKPRSNHSLYKHNTRVSLQNKNEYYLLILCLGVMTGCLCILLYTISVLRATSLHLYIFFSLSCCWVGVSPVPSSSSCMACSRDSVRAKVHKHALIYIQP